MNLIPTWQLYGEETPFPDLMHIERIPDRAQGLEWQIAPHRHLHLHQVFLLSAGEISITMDSVQTRVEPPALLNIPRGVVHSFRFSSGADGFVLTLPVALHPDLFGPTAATSAASAQAFIAAAPPGIAAVFTALSAEHTGGQSFRSTLLKAQAAQILGLTLRAAPAQMKSRPGDQRMQRFDALLAEHMRDRWRVENYADALGVSSRHLNRLCHEATGQSAQACVAAQTIREACRLLAYTRMSVQSIGFHLGFDDPSYFSRMFQRSVGISPRDYRGLVES